MTEDKVRKAFEVAHELAQQAGATEYYAVVFNRVFDALIYESLNRRAITVAEADDDDLGFSTE